MENIWLPIALGALVSIPFSILSNLATPWIKFEYRKFRIGRGLKETERKLAMWRYEAAEIEERLAFYEKVAADPALQTAAACHAILDAVGRLAAAAVLFFYGNFAAWAQRILPSESNAPTWHEFPLVGLYYCTLMVLAFTAWQSAWRTRRLLHPKLNPNALDEDRAKLSELQESIRIARESLGSEGDS